MPFFKYSVYLFFNYFIVNNPFLLFVLCKLIFYFYNKKVRTSIVDNSVDNVDNPLYYKFFDTIDYFRQ